MSKVSGVELIAKERKEQIEKHGFSIIDDAEYYEKMELVAAALFCIDQTIGPGYGLKTYKEWPAGWDDKFKHKILAKDEIGQLQVAGAFIAARIDQLLYNQSQNTQNGKV